MSRFFPLIVAIVLIDDAVQMRSGNFSIGAISNVAIALLLVAGVVGGVELAFSSRRWLVVALAVAAIYELHFWFHSTRLLSAELRIGAGLAAMAAVALIAFRGWRLPFAVLCALVLILSLLSLEKSPAIDVFVFHQHAWDALRTGHSPYGGMIPNIYGHLRFYSDRFADVNNVFVGFPYPPLSLLLSLPALALGDPRYATALAWVLAAIVAAGTGRHRLALLAGALLLAFPRTFFVADNAWTEPLVVVLFALVVFCAERAPRWLGLVLGLFLAVKQYDVLILPLVFLLRPKRAVFVQAFVVALLVTAPLALTNPQGFWHDVVSFQFAQPFRDEALSFDNLFGWRAAWPAFALLVPATALALWRAPRNASGFALSAGFVWLVFFAFNKQAFCNYYALVIGAFCLSLSALRDL